MRTLFKIPRIAFPTLSRRTITLWLAGIVALSAVIAPGVSTAVATFTLKKAQKQNLGNTTVATVSGTAAAEAVTEANVDCPEALQATSGGADSPALAASGGEYPWLVSSAPLPGSGRSTGWHVEIYNAFANPQAFTAYAVCAP